MKDYIYLKDSHQLKQTYTTKAIYTNTAKVMYMTDSQQLNRQKQQNIKQCIIYITDNQNPDTQSKCYINTKEINQKKTNTHIYFFWYNLYQVCS